MNEENNSEIWSEFFRVKNRLMDYDENLRDAISNIQMLITLRRSSGQLRQHYAKAQKHISLILDLGISAGAIPTEADPKDIEFIKGVSKGNYKSIEDLEKAQDLFRNYYRKTKFYDVTVTTDNRPAVVRKYGKARFSQ